MRNLLISLTFIFALIFGISTSAFSQAPDSSVSITITIGEGAGTFEGTGIVVPITARVSAPSMVDVKIQKGKKVLYTKSIECSERLSLTIPVSDMITWGSGDFKITAITNGVSLISEEFTF